MTLTWLVTGANRGIGLEIVRQLSVRTEVNIIATVRSLSPRPPQTSLFEMGSKYPKRLSILELDVSSLDSISAFVSTVSASQHTKIDFLLNNAGMNADYQNSQNFSPEKFQQAMNVNVVGPAKLTSALVEAKLVSAGSVVMNMSSSFGSVTLRIGRNAQHVPTRVTAYCISKAALNMLTAHQAADLQAKAITVIAMDPGWVKTDMGGAGAALEPEDSVAGILKVLDGLTENDSGKYYTYTGEELPW
jgi:NAD(P)-dependent dehydrogenase (short-subunit alcohol dehydrogenase family)